MPMIPMPATKRTAMPMPTKSRRAAAQGWPAFFGVEVEAGAERMTGATGPAGTGWSNTRPQPGQRRLPAVSGVLQFVQVKDIGFLLKEQSFVLTCR